MFGTIMSAQGHAESDYAGLLGILSGKYDTIINVPLAFSNALGASLVPSLVATAKSGNRRQVNSKISLFVRFNMMIAIPSAVGLFVLAKPILDLIFFTENNDVSAKMLQIGAVSVIFYCLSTVTNAVHQGLDNMMVPVKSASISLVVHIVSLFVMMVVPMLCGRRWVTYRSRRRRFSYRSLHQLLWERFPWERTPFSAC